MMRQLLPLAALTVFALQACSTVPRNDTPVQQPVRQQNRVVRTAPPPPPTPVVTAPAVRTAPLSLPTPTRPVEIRSQPEIATGSSESTYGYGIPGDSSSGYGSSYPQGGYSEPGYGQDAYGNPVYPQDGYNSSPPYPQDDYGNRDGWQHSDSNTGIDAAAGYPQSDTSRDSYSNSPGGDTSAPQSAVVNSILAQADTQQGSGKLDQAAASIERGLRIEPRNAVLWGRLAKIRIEQNRPDQAEALAQKAIRFAQGDRAELRKNWLTIAEARRLNGDPSGAAEARRNADQY